MAKFTLISRDVVDEMLMLYQMKIDNAYIVVEQFNEYSTICQYSAKYDTLKLITVLSENLDSNLRLHEG